MKIDGGCHCGALTYEAEIDPDTMTICHCTDCQKMSGTAFRTVIRAHEDNFKTSENGTPRAMGFCENCGTQIYGTSVGEGSKTLGIRGGTVTQSAQLKPVNQIWTRSAQPWVCEIEGMEVYETSLVAG